jgi:hypothetical protein
MKDASEDSSSNPSRADARFASHQPLLIFYRFSRASRFI